MTRQAPRYATTKTPCGCRAIGPAGDEALFACQEHIDSRHLAGAAVHAEHLAWVLATGTVTNVVNMPITYGPTEDGCA